ncbi:MAG: tryptophan--tRNA ligase [Candidatus Paceibacterota bacterium]
MQKKVVLSGIRATGLLHLGNYLGVLTRFAEMSKNNSYKSLFFVADLHTLTTLKEARMIQRHMPNIVIDYLAAGISLENSFIYLQSDIPQVTELAWYLSCITPAKDLESLPTYKDKVAKHPEDVNAGLFNYPVLMAADIIGPQADLVPVGKDQQAHLELTVSLVKRLNHLYKTHFPIPDALINEMITVPGLSAMGENGFPKMGKSDGNTIVLSEIPGDTWQKIKTAPTDPNRRLRTDVGNPEHCSIFQLHKLISAPDEINWSKNGCEKAEIGCIDCKKLLSVNVNSLLEEFRERRKELVEKPNLIRDVLEAGKAHVTPIFNETIAVVRDRIGIKEMIFGGG